ncbi:retinoid- and fatty-acid binding glycoprotein apolipophorin [Lasioglossum baleicum]|uniref:retinoid- and fatty-acid binding glycoprotein apolipophorin n=1 Tax=Lasioglossum baleicum TaxID=434251 RepID=UPI003FCE852B
MGHPPRLMGTALACLFLIFAAVDASGKCTTGCHGIHPNKGYQEGHTYVYQLTGKTVTSVSQAQKDAQLDLSATVELSVKPDCIHQLWLKDVQINGERSELPGLENAIQFNYHNGHIDSELCATPDDPQASLNIKRAVISLFQSAVLQDSGAATHHETDVLGVCPTSFLFHKKGEVLLVEKTRNLEQCAFRENSDQGLISTTVDTAAGLKTSPLLASSQTIKQRFKQGVLESATSTEVHKLRPFSNGEAGTKTVVQTSLILKSEKPDTPTAPVTSPKSLIFDVPHPVVKYQAKDIANAVKAAQEQIAGGVKPEAASKFADLVKVLRRSAKNDILSTYQKVKAGAGFDKTSQQVLLDGLFHAGNGDAAEVGVQLIKNKELTDVQTLFFYTSLALIRHAQLPTVQAVTSLLDQPNLPRIGYLGIGQVIGKYCQDHPCENVPEVKEAVHKIREKVGNGKAKTREQENVVVSALKSLGNTRFLDDATLTKLANIAADKSVKNRVRVAAIEALPTRCSMKWKNIAFKVLADKEQDSEIRIKTYLALVACPCPHVATQLKETLDKETVNQVGSFIQSHLRNLRASTDPGKINAQHHLGQIKPRTKFPEDFRKFSYNDELSYKVDSLGLGSTVEQNVIYSQDSFVPRSANLNVTVELFGRNLNLVDLSARVDNLDKVLEHWFGPKGAAWKTELEDVKEEVKGARDTVANVASYTKKKFESLIRGKRAAVDQGELDRFAKKVHLRGNTVDKNLDLDISLKLFGVELAYLSLEDNGTKQKDPVNAIIDKIFEQLQKTFDSTKNLQHDTENYIQFLEAELVYPTNLGTSLSLGLIGTSAFKMHSDGNLDLAKIFDDPKNAAFRIALKPSVSVRIAGNIIVEGLGVESGLKVVSTLYTATSTDLSVKVLNGKGVDVQFSIPKKTQEVINVNSEVLVSSKGKTESAFTTKGKEYKDCFDQFSTIIGLTVCGEVSFPYDGVANVQQKPLFPLSGPAKFAATIDNVDANAYRFKVHLNDEDPAKRSFEILLDTPGSKTNREISLRGEAATQPNLYAQLQLNSPFKKVQLEAALKNNEKERTLTVQLVHDSIKYFGRIGVEAKGNKYKPVLEYNVPEHIQRLAGVSTGPKSDKKYSVQGTVDVIDHEGGQKFTTDKVALLVGDQEIVSVAGSLAWTPTSVNVASKLGYADKFLVLDINGKTVPGSNYALSVLAKPSTDPNIAFKLEWELKREEGSLDNKLVFVHGADLASEVNQVSLKQNAVYKLKPGNLLLSTSNELKYPAVNLKVKLDGKITPKSIDTDVELKYEKFKFGTELSGKIGKEKPGDYELELEAELMDNKIELKSKRSILEPSKSKYTNSLVLTPGGKYDSETTIIWDVTKENATVQLNGDANLNGKKVKVYVDLEANQQLLNSLVFVRVDGVKYVELTLKTKKSPHPSGHLNLIVKSYLTANGQYTYQNGKGNANLNIDIPKIDRKIQATGQIAVNGPEHAGNVEILYDAKKDPTKKIKLTTNNHITKTSLDTKNVLEVLDKKLEVNGKHSQQGTWNNGVLDLSVDITLPDGRNINSKLNREIVKKDNKYDVKVDSELAYSEQKGGPSTKILLKENGKIVDEKNGEIQSSITLKLIDTEGKDVVAVLNLGKKQQDDKNMSNVDLEVSGAKIPKKAKLAGKFEGNELAGKTNVDASLGDDWKLSNKAEYDLGNNVDKPAKYDGVFQLKLPFEKLKDLKLETNIARLDAYLGDRRYESSTLAKLTYNSDNTILLQKEFKADNVGGNLDDFTGKVEGKDKLSVNIAPHKPLNLEGSYKYVPTDEKKTADVELKFEHADKKVSLTSNNVYKPEEATVNLKLKSSLPIEKFRNVDLQLDYKRNKPESKGITDIVVNADGVKYTLNSEIYWQEALKSLSVVSSCPNGKSELLCKYQKLGPNEYKGEWSVRIPKGFVIADVHLDLDSVDEFAINANFDSDKTKYRKIHAEIANKPTAKTGKRIIITVTSDGQNIVTGSTSYKKRDEEGKIVIEGNGSLKVGDDTKSSSFKYTRQQLTNEKDGEVGVAVILNANFGPSAIVGELKLSNKELHVFNSYCEQTKDCAHFKLQSTLEAPTDKLNLKHQLTVEVDLKKFNVPAEFGLKTNTQYNYPQLDHSSNLYLHTTKDKSEYTYQLYVHPKESASILTLPTREVALILIHDLPKTKQTGAYKLDLSLYLDKKNKPSDKTSLTANGDINIDKDSLSLSGDAKFSYPTQSKDLSVKGRLHCSNGEKLLEANVDLDIFEKKSQKISIAANVQRQPVSDGYNISSNIDVNSRGQQLKLNEKTVFAITSSNIELGYSFSYNDIHQKTKTVEALFSADKNHVLLLIALPDKVLIKDEWKFQISKDTQSLNGELTLFGQPTEVLKIEGKGLNSFELVKFRKDNPNNKLTVNGQVVLGQLAEIHADSYKDGAKKKLFRILVHLDEKQFLKPDISYEKANVVEAFEEAKNNRLEHLKKLKETQEQVAKAISLELEDFWKHLDKALPNLKPLVEYYNGELNKLKQEINADETVKEIQATFNKYFGGIVAAITEILKDLAQVAQKLQKQLAEVLSSLKEAGNSIYPKLKESYEKIFKKYLEIVDAIAKLVNAQLNLLLDLLNSHKKELHDLLNLVSGVAQDFSKALSKILEQIKHDVEQFSSQLASQVKALPVYEIVKAKLEELKNFQVPNAILGPLEELCSVVKNVLPTQELQQLAQVFCTYLSKIIKHEKINLSDALKEIAAQAEVAIRSILVPLKGLLGGGDDTLSSLKLQSPIDWSLLYTIPGTPTLQLSLINLVRNRELPSLSDLYHTYRPTLYPSDIIPPFSKSGVITDGGHIFTFDGRHLTLPGSCSYVLAQDIEDGNFSVVASLNKGTLNSITLTAPEESITIKSNGNILVNNKRADYPASTENLHAFLVPPFANVKSDYGVRVSCVRKAPLVCAVHVSGFYHGKLRGLLGYNNNEPYDDFTLPSGTISESASEFGNAYKLKGDCPAVPAVDHKDRAPICTDYFIGQNSPLKSCFKYVNPSQYREGCDHAVASGSSNGACLIAEAYHYSCYAAGILTTNIPPACTSCKVGAGSVGIGDTFSVKTPKKEADIVIVVEQLAPNEKVFKELVTPLISQLRDELKADGITDVHIGLIGFADQLKWPQHYTVNGDTNIVGDVTKNIKFFKKSPTITLEEATHAAVEKQLSAKKILLPLEYLKQKLDVELGTLTLTDAYEEAIHYPYRAGAAKVVIGVHVNVCEKSPLPISLQQIRLLLGQKTYRDLGLTYYHISYPRELVVSGKPQKNIVGYDKHSVYTYGDSDAARPLTGRADLKNNLDVSPTDVCADFAVSSGGALFNLGTFIDAKPNQKKQFIQVAAKRVADGVANLELEQDCLCEYQFGIVGRAKCKIVGRKEKSSTKDTKAGVKG